MSANADPGRRFKATGDDGLRYTITEFATQHVEAGGGATEPSTRRHFKTDDGRSVESRGDGTYVLLETGVTLRADMLDSY
jgi:hypothetical protein